eukprot:m.472528 g.472528  ORF g.472528 m.472528 type:complete len:97 (+) comp32914_c0_seq1:65-355(+)
MWLVVRVHDDARSERHFADRVSAEKYTRDCKIQVVSAADRPSLDLAWQKAFGCEVSHPARLEYLLDSGRLDSHLDALACQLVATRWTIVEEQNDEW